MEILYFSNYKEKKSHKNYANLIEYLDNIENKVKSANSIEELTFYQELSNHKKLIRFGGYRLSLFIHKDYCLFVDFEIKQVLEHSSESIDKLLCLDKENDFYINFIESNKKSKKTLILDLNPYKGILEINEHCKERELCFESKKFAKMLLSNKSKQKDVFQVLQNNILDYDNSSNIYHNYKSIFKIEENNIIIYYKLITERDTNIIFLIHEDDNFKEIDNIINKNDLVKKAVKSYPLEIFLEDSEEWIEYVVKNSDGNIALSPEEENILIDLKSYNNENKFPFFINGRAGSGKSTILQYLFADYLLEFIKMKKENDGLEYDPIYLTYNDRLKEKAIDKVISIILAKTKKEIKESLNLKEKNAIQRQIEGYFKSFDSAEGYNFLQELLYLNKKENSLKDREKIYFEKIKDYFSEQIRTRGRRFKHYTPELIWYVIRSYIKGRGYIENGKLKPLEPDAYKKLPKKLKTIKDNVFETIYNQFYKTYQRFLNENNYYDDLDLVFEIYKKNAFNKKYSVIFCDESQDFTKVEFDLILNLNIFLEKNIKVDNFEHKHIPIVFAGDPFQTINPTGFTFEYLKALVYESYDEKGANIELNYKDLQFNYRSNDDIIKFSNLIQILRGVIFNNKHITIQTRWLDNFAKGHSILLFNDRIKKETHYQFIFPTNKKNDYEEDSLFQGLDLEKIDLPIDIKGLEYHTIVLYRFGDFYRNNYENIKKFIDNGFEDRESSLPYEYFFNNFYVAITRAKEKIIIIDSIEAKNDFWKHIDIDILFNKFKSINGNITEKNELSTFVEGKEDDLVLNEEEQIIYTVDKIKIDIFERYENDKNKTILLNEIGKILKIKQLNEVYTHVLEGLKAENNGNYLKSIKKLMQSSILAKENGELSKNQIAYLNKKAFYNLWKSIKLEDENSLIFLNQYKDIFKSLGLKYERKVSLLDKFLNRQYANALDYIKAEFDIRDKDNILSFIIDTSLNYIEDYELPDYLKDLFYAEFISQEQIIEIIKQKIQSDDFKNYRSLIKIFENIDGLKKQYKDIYCKIILPINPNDIDCLFYTNKLDNVVSLIKEDKDLDVSNYYRPLLHYISKNKDIELLEKLNINLLIEEYFKFYNELNYIDIWRYILGKIFADEQNYLYIPSIIKFFKGKYVQTKEKHLKVLIECINKNEKPVLDNHLFNSLISLFNKISQDFKICYIISALEKTMSFYEEENINKILEFYKNYMDNGKNKFKPLVGSRLIKIMYELDHLSKNIFKKSNHSESEAWFDYVKKRYKFLKVKSNESIMKRIPSRINLDLCQQLLNLKTVDDIYDFIVKDFTKKDRNKDTSVSDSIINNAIVNGLSNENTENYHHIEGLEVSNFNIVDILEKIQSYIDENRGKFTKIEIKRINNVVAGLMEDLKEIKKEF